MFKLAPKSKLALDIGQSRVIVMIVNQPFWQFSTFHSTSFKLETEVQVEMYRVILFLFISLRCALLSLVDNEQVFDLVCFAQQQLPAALPQYVCVPAAICRSC